jgi:hypothetical protein
MPIRIARPPAGGDQAIDDALASLQGRRAPAPHARNLGFDAGPETPPLAMPGLESARGVETAAPHPVYTAGLDDLAAGKLLDAARPDGWRYLLVRGDEAVATATVGVPDAGGAPGISHITQGPFVEATLEALHRAEALDEVRGGDFELRLLDVPALYLRALWLHGPRDILLPLPPAPEPLEAYRPYREGEVVAALRDRAAERLRMPSDYGG